jgi:tetratricopeptide (TPR) repeat protein
MGLFSWFFPSADDRVANARKRMAAERWADARLEVLDLDRDDAREIVATCERALAQMNLDAAVSWCEAADDARVVHHMEMAQNFRRDGMEEAFKEARRQMRVIRQERTAAEERAREAEQARLLSADPFGVSGGPSWRDPTMPDDLLAATDDEAAARLALVVEGYDVALRKTVGGLGAAFARALLDFEDGRPDLAIQALLELPDDEPVVRFERARTAYAMGDAAAAARELRAFAKLHGSHVSMGRHHTASFLALCLAESGDPAAGLRVLRSARQSDPKLGGSLFAQLLQLTGDLDAAESELVGLIRTYPKDTSLYKMLAGIQLAKHDRMKAMTVLEQSLTACACSPGQCGYRPPDGQVLTMLSQLYLEDRVDVPRGLELAEQAAQLVQQPTWDDAYLQALVADRSGHPNARRLIDGLHERTPHASAQHDRLVEHLPG